MDRRRLKVFGFTFHTDRAPSEFWLLFSGRAEINIQLCRNAFLRWTRSGTEDEPWEGCGDQRQRISQLVSYWSLLVLQNRTAVTTPRFSIPAIRHTYTGDQDIILELPEDYDIYHIDWLSVYCSQFNIDFGHVKIGSEISPSIPPYVPLQRKVSAHDYGCQFWVLWVLWASVRMPYRGA